MPRPGAMCGVCRMEWAAQVCQGIGRAMCALPRRAVGALGAFYDLTPARWMVGACHSSLSFLEVMSLHVLTYPYSRGSSFGVARHFMRSLGAPRLWGGHARPLTLGVE
jgi:hypothetical protein